jgi:ATP-dependent RNA helicase DeaD
VINFDPPADHHTYIHRVGRTGRAGNRGVGVTLVGTAERQDMRKLARRLGVNHDLGSEQHTTQASHASSAPRRRRRPRRVPA